MTGSRLQHGEIFGNWGQQTTSMQVAARKFRMMAKKGWYGAGHRRFASILQIII